MSTKQRITKLPYKIHESEHHHVKNYRYDFQLTLVASDREGWFVRGHEESVKDGKQTISEILEQMRINHGLHKGELIGFGCVEFGKFTRFGEGERHLHLLISFDGLRRKERKADVLKTILAAIRASGTPTTDKRGKAAREVRYMTNLGSFRGLLQPVSKGARSQKKAVNYFCKVERDRDFKTFVFPKWFNGERREPQQQKKAA